MTDQVKLLSDDEVAKIEAAQVKRRESLAFHRTEYPNLPTPPLHRRDRLPLRHRACAAG